MQENDNLQVLTLYGLNASQVGFLAVIMKTSEDFEDTLFSLETVEHYNQREPDNEFKNNLAKIQGKENGQEESQEEHQSV